MHIGTLALLLTKIALFSYVGVRFFRKGAHTPFWFLTLLPFVLLLVALPAYTFGLLQPLVTFPPVVRTVAEGVASVLCALAIALFASALSTHRERIPMWHQPIDLPDGVVTWGPYAYVRHPFYASYYLFFVAAMLAAPAWPVLAVSLYALVMLNHTAAVEERQLCESPLGESYRAYLSRTGRFIPRLTSSRGPRPKTATPLHT